MYKDPVEFLVEVIVNHASKEEIEKMIADMKDQNLSYSDREQVRRIEFYLNKRL